MGDTTKHVKDTLRDRIRNSGLVSDSQISWEGYNSEPFTPVSTSPWLRPSVRTDGAAWVAFGNARARGRVSGVAIVEVFSPIGTGTAAGATLADSVIALFDLWSPGSGMRFPQKAYAREIGRVEGGWWKWNVYAPFTRDQILTAPA